MAKPAGPDCNLACSYCFYREKEQLYPAGTVHRMSDEVLESYVRQYLAAHDGDTVEFAWQGGEPTLLGLGFFQRVVALQARYANGRQVTNALQTNGVLLDSQWGDFLAANRFLVGLSIDGPPEVHDRHRIDRGGRPSFALVDRGLRVLRDAGVLFNTLTVVTRQSAEHGALVYQFLREEGSGFLQFIPIVERRAVASNANGLTLVGPQDHPRARVTGWSVDPSGYGRFLNEVFDRWVRTDVGRVFLQPVDIALGAWLGQPAGLCTAAETCGRAVVVEHNGDVYSCDHFVYPACRLGNLLEQPLVELVASPAQQRFGAAKRDALPQYCRACTYLFACHGGCPKHRILRTPAGEPGLNYLCAGYRAFYGHLAPYLDAMAGLLRAGRPAAEIMPCVDQLVPSSPPDANTGGRNAPCPCGSGRKRKRCCGR